MKNKFKIILINMVIFFLILLIIDPLVGDFILHKQNTVYLKRNIILKEHLPYQDTVFKPSKSELLSSQNLEEKNFKFQTDSNGFIIGPNSTDSPVDIIFFGGSTTECIYVDEDLRWPYLVSQFLVDQSGQQINTRNAGVSGNDSMHSTLNLIAKGLNCKPKIVVLMNNINDLSNLIKTESYWKSPPSRAIIQEEKASNKKELAIVFLRAAKNLTIPNIYWGVRVFLKNISEKLKSNSSPYDEWVDFRGIILKPEDFIKIQNQYKSSLLSFVNIAKSWGIEPILMTQFNRLNTGDTFIKMNYSESGNGISYEDFVKYYDIFNEIVRDAAKNENCILIDLANEIPSTSKYIYDAVHVNNEGSVLVAKVISKTISEKFNSYKLKTE